MRSQYNQDVVDELNVIYQQRAQTSDEQSMLSYARAVSMLKSFPEDLHKNPLQAKHLKGIGPKIFSHIQKFYQTGTMPEADIIRDDNAFKVCCQFTEVYRIGPKKARELYMKGYRTIEQLIESKEWLSSKGWNISVPDALRILPDLQQKIPRGEVEEIARLLRLELDRVCPGTKSLIVGGYRRGKEESNDVDIVCTWPPGGDTGIPSQEQIRKLRDNLTSQGLITHLIAVHNFDPQSKPHWAHHKSEDSQRDDLPTMEFVFKAPATPTVPVSMHRRVDLIFAPYRVFGAAVLGWTGSRQFERDLRRFAREQGYKFHSTGLVHNTTQEVITTYDERDVFEELNLLYMPPEWRNCDA